MSTPQPTRVLDRLLAWKIPSTLGTPDLKNFQILTWTVLIGFLVSVAFHYILAASLQAGYPMSTFLFKPHDEFRDFINMFFVTKDLSPYNSNHFFNSNYFPFANIVFYVFSLVGHELFALVLFLGIFVMIYGAALAVMRRSWPEVSGLSIFLAGVLNYPVVFAVDRANLELYLFLAVAGFVYFYFVSPRPMLAVIFLAVAISMKLYPGVFVVLLLRDRRWKELGVLVAACAVLTGLSLAAFQGGPLQNLTLMFDSFRNFVNVTGDFSSLQHNASLWGSISLFALAIKILWFGGSIHVPDALDFGPVIPLAYLGLTAAIFLMVAAFIVLKRLSDRDAILSLTILMILLPNVSFDYKLILFLLPLLFHLPHAEDRSIVVLLALIMIPKDYVLIYHDISISVILNVLIMLMLLVVLLVRALRKDPHTVAPPVGV